MTSPRMRRPVAALVGLLALTLALSGQAGAAPAPDGFDRFLVYLADGVYDPADTGSAPDGDVFQREIMQRTTEEIAAEYARAERFFRERFGLDFTTVQAVDGLKTIEGVATLETDSFMFDPRNEYRAYVVSGMTAPDEGWVVRDGGWRVALAEGGTTLHGTWGGEDGIEVPGGSFVVFGDYNIETGGEPIVIHYESGSPIVPMGPDGIMAFSCDLFHPEWGHGRANGTVLAPQELGDGTVKVSIRNVLTFPPR